MGSVADEETELAKILLFADCLQVLVYAVESGDPIGVGLEAAILKDLYRQALRRSS